MIEAKVIADSISEYDKRITTLQLKYPRYIHAEVMTHRVFSRNASSSRAIPVGKLAQSSLDEMVTPIVWGLNQAGMQAKMEELQGSAREEAEALWRNMAKTCAEGAAKLAELGLHKQWANRPLEWFGHISVVITSTEWSNFFALRDHELAQPEIKALAIAMKRAMYSSIAEVLEPGEWHLPYITIDDRVHSLGTQKKVSAARCARVSYLKHDGTSSSVEEDLQLFDRLVGTMPIHASPCEHQATPIDYSSIYYAYDTNPLQGNFKGWVQYRKELERTFGANLSG